MRFGGMSSSSSELLLLLALAADAQLEVQIRRYDQVVCNSGLSNYSRSADYSFSSGLSSYVNIPAGGITGILYQPEPEDGCSSFNSSFHCQCAESSNSSRVALLDDYHLCTAQKIRHIQEASFDAIITYSVGDRCLDVEWDAHNPNTNESLDISVPLAVVSEEFYAELLMTATVRNCSEYITLVSLRVGSTKFGSVSSVLISIFVLCGLLILAAQLMCCFLVCLVCDKLFRRKRGRYNVQENHMHELGSLREPSIAVSRGVHILPYTPEEREFHRKEGDTHTQCSICLEDFQEGEVITPLACDKNHAFHPSCIDKWLNTHSTCPVCRTSTFS